MLSNKASLSCPKNRYQQQLFFPHVDIEPVRALHQNSSFMHELRISEWNSLPAVKLVDYSLIDCRGV